MSRKIFRSEAGSVIAETAVSVGIFMLFLLTTVDAVFYMYSVAATQFSINQAARKMILSTNSNLNIKTEIVNTAAKYGIRLRPGDIKVCDPADILLDVNLIPQVCVSEMPTSASAQPMSIWVNYITPSSLKLFGLTNVKVEAYVFNEPF